MTLENDQNIEASNAYNQEEQFKNNLEFSTVAKSKDFRILFLILSIILSILIIFKIFASISQVNHVLSKLEDILELFSNKECQKIEIKFNLRGFLENLKLQSLKNNFINILSIISLLYLSINESNQIFKRDSVGAIISFFCSFIILIISDINCLSKINSVLVIFSYLFASFICCFLHKRIRNSTLFLFGLLLFYVSYWVFFVFFGAEIQKWALSPCFKTFSEVFRNSPEIFNHIEKICEKYNFDIDKIYVWKRYSRFEDIKGFDTLLIQDAFTSIITIESPDLMNNLNLKQLLTSFIATNVVKAFYNLKFYPYLVKSAISLVHLLFISVFIAYFESMMYFHEITAVFFSIQYIFNEYLCEIAFNMAYKKIFGSVLEKMMESPQESRYILNEMLRMINLSPALFSIAPVFQIFSPYPSIELTCDEALEGITNSN